MNRKILQKIIDNLNSEKPDLSYIRGVLETIIEGLPGEQIDTYKTIIKEVPGGLPYSLVIKDKDPEVAALDSLAAANLEKVRKMGGII